MNAKEEKLKNLIFFKILLTGKRILKNKIRWRSQWQFFFCYFILFVLCIFYTMNEFIFNFFFLFEIERKFFLNYHQWLTTNEWMNAVCIHHTSTLLLLSLLHISVWWKNEEILIKRIDELKFFFNKNFSQLVFIFCKFGHTEKKEWN